MSGCHTKESPFKGACFNGRNPPGQQTHGHGITVDVPVELWAVSGLQCGGVCARCDGNAVVVAGCTVR